MVVNILNSFNSYYKVSSTVHYRNLTRLQHKSTATQNMAPVKRPLRALSLWLFPIPARTSKDLEPH